MHCDTSIKNTIKFIFRYLSQKNDINFITIGRYRYFSYLYVLNKCLFASMFTEINLPANMCVCQVFESFAILGLNYVN